MNGNLPQLLHNKDLDRLRRYQEYLDFYKGIQWQERGCLTFNYAKTFIDKVTSYLMSGVSFAIDPPTNSPEDKKRAKEAEQALLRVYEENNLELLDFDTEIDCAILGDACYKVIWDTREKRVRVTAPDVQGIYAWWLGDDVSRVYRVASRYTLSVEELKLISPKLKVKGDKVTIIEDWTADRFSFYVGDEVFREINNPYGFIPFVIYPNLREPKSFWGISDLPQIMEPQQELNRAFSQLSRILELSGNPIAVLENIEEASDIAVTPGAVWTIPEDARAYLLDLLQGGGVRLHIDYINALYRVLHDLSESPRAAFGGTERDLSGVALQTELYSLIQKVKRKRLIRSVAYRERNEMILKLLQQHKVIDASGLRHQILWGPILPEDILRHAQAQRLMVDNALRSRHRAMTELGILDPELELSQWLEETKLIKGVETRDAETSSA